MQMPMCSRCGKNVAVIFITKMDPNNKDGATQEGLCLKCARQLGIKPLDQMMEQMGLNDDTIDMLSSEINSLEDLGALMPAGPDVEDEDMSDEEAMADAGFGRQWSSSYGVKTEQRRGGFEGEAYGGCNGADGELGEGPAR